MSKLFSASHVHVGVLNDYIPENRPITVAAVSEPGRTVTAEVDGTLLPNPEFAELSGESLDADLVQLVGRNALSGAFT